MTFRDIAIQWTDDFLKVSGIASILSDNSTLPCVKQWQWYINQEFSDDKISLKGTKKTSLQAGGESGY